MQLDVNHVSKAFRLRGRDGTLKVLDDISLRIATGEVVVLLGPSGCGKSTLLNIIAGFLAALRGPGATRRRPCHQAR